MVRSRARNRGTPIIFITGMAWHDSAILKGYELGAFDFVILSQTLHDTLGGIGVAAILLLPHIMKKVIPRKDKPGFYRMSQIVFIVGLLTVLLFTFRYLPDKNNFFSIYKGLWQRIFMLNTYVYFITIAVLLIMQPSKLS